MATDPNRFIALGMPSALANAVAEAIDNAEITVTLTGEVTGTDTVRH